MSAPKTKSIAFVNIIYDYLIGLNDIYMAPFLADWPSKPFKTRTVSQNTLPVLSYLPELVAPQNAETERIVAMLTNSAEHLSWEQT